MDPAHARKLDRLRRAACVFLAKDPNQLSSADSDENIMFSMEPNDEGLNPRMPVRHSSTRLTTATASSMKDMVQVREERDSALKELAKVKKKLQELQGDSQTLGRPPPAKRSSMPSLNSGPLGSTSSSIAGDHQAGRSSMSSTASAIASGKSAARSLQRAGTGGLRSAGGATVQTNGALKPKTAPVEAPARFEAKEGEVAGKTVAALREQLEASRRMLRAKDALIDGLKAQITDSQKLHVLASAAELRCGRIGELLFQRRGEDLGPGGMREVPRDVGGARLSSPAAKPLEVDLRRTGASGPFPQVGPYPRGVFPPALAAGLLSNGGHPCGLLAPPALGCGAVFQKLAIFQSPTKPLVRSASSISPRALPPQLGHMRQRSFPGGQLSLEDMSHLSPRAGRTHVSSSVEFEPQRNGPMRQRSVPGGQFRFDGCCAPSPGGVGFAPVVPPCPAVHRAVSPSESAHSSRGPLGPKTGALGGFLSQVPPPPLAPSAVTLQGQSTALLPGGYGVMARAAKVLNAAQRESPQSVRQAPAQILRSVNAVAPVAVGGIGQGRPAGPEKPASPDFGEERDLGSAAGLQQRPRSGSQTSSELHIARTPPAVSRISPRD